MRPDNSLRAGIRAESSTHLLLRKSSVLHFLHLRVERAQNRVVGLWAFLPLQTPSLGLFSSSVSLVSCIYFRGCAILYTIIERFPIPYQRNLTPGGQPAFPTADEQSPFRQSITSAVQVFRKWGHRYRIRRDPVIRFLADHLKAQL